MAIQRNYLKNTKAKWTVGFLLLLMLSIDRVLTATCTNGLCLPWETTPVTYGPPPAGSTTNCDVFLDSVTHDFATVIIMGGRTQDSNRVLGGTGLNCYS